MCLILGHNLHHQEPHNIKICSFFAEKLWPSEAGSSKMRVLSGCEEKISDTTVHHLFSSRQTAWHETVRGCLAFVESDTATELKR